MTWLTTRLRDARIASPLRNWLASSPGWLRGAAAHQAWTAWANGDIDQLEDLAPQAGPGQREHLLFLSRYVQGRYHEALAHYAALQAEHRGLAELDEPVTQAWLHLGRPQEAAAHVHRRVGSRPLPPKLALRVRHPLDVRLDRTAVIPFVDHELAAVLPGLAATIDGASARVHLDTGAPFVVMGTGRAAALGIRLNEGSEHAHHGLTATRVRHGVISELQLGHATLTNVPVEALPSLRAEQDVVLLGTNVLEQFLTTVDYPGKRLILSPRRDLAEAAVHVALIGDHEVAAEFPFRLWDDHYMFARGAFGRWRELNFLVDSGWVYVVEDDNGHSRQACLWVTAKQYRHWGVARQLVAGPHFVSPELVSLGPLEQADQLVATVATRRAPWASLGGVRIDGLLSHSLLQRYSWTLDFDRHRYEFRESAANEPRGAAPA